jgi:hypothetical protein
MGARVDKGWQDKGIDTFSTEAILGTLAHYGVAIDEGGFKALAGTLFPYAMAVEWHDGWKGTGQFSRFPLSAAEELWRRWCPNELTPIDVAVTLRHLVNDVWALIEKRPLQGPLETRFTVVEALLPRMAGPRAEPFVEELVAVLGEEMEAVNALVTDLEKAGHAVWASRFAKLEEALFPLRAGVVTAMLKHVRGDTQGAKADLMSLASAKTGLARVGVISALMEVGTAPAEVEKMVLGLMHEAQEPFNLDLAEEVAMVTEDFLEWVPEGYDRRPVGAAIDALLDVMESRQTE